MSEGYIINSMGRHPELKMSPKNIAQELRNNWAIINIRENVSDNYVLWWSLELDGRTSLGGMQSDYQTITIYGGPLGMAAEFAIWYRKLIPQDYQLFLWKGSKFDKPIELSEVSSKDELTGILTYY